MKLHRLLVSAGAVLLAGLCSAAEIAGTVTGPNGPEAGVWVIAETNDLSTKFARIVVTDDEGRYLVPDLPKAEYDLWVRGYGLIDSPKVKARPGEKHALAAVPAPSEREAAQYYPAIYWFALMRAPQESEFPIGKLASQAAWLHSVKQGDCQSCHALGTPALRVLKEVVAHDAAHLGEAGLKSFAQWSEEIGKGALPFARPERPQGRARNLVVSVWDWSQPGRYLQELAATDRRNPRLNAHGRLYGAAGEGHDFVPILDPRTHSSSTVAHPVRDAQSRGTTLDEKGRVWFSARAAGGAHPEFCKARSRHRSAKAFPLEGEAPRHLSMFDPKRGAWKLVRTCFSTDQLSFALDDDHTLWASTGAEGAPVVGFFNRYIYERTGNEALAQGWTPLVLDTNGDGRRGAYTEPDEPLDPKKDKRIAVSLHALTVSPLDGAVWGTAPGHPGGIVRLMPGADPTHSALAEYYEVPAPGYGPRGGDIDTNGVHWVSLASGHLGRFVRAECKVVKGPGATGKHCPEGWTLHPLPGPQLQDVKAPGSAEVSHHTWVDWEGILGLGSNVPIAMGNGADALHALVKGKFVTLHIPYPQGLFPRSLDGRIDDERAGWKGRGLWTASGTRALHHGESGREGRQKVVKLQVRPHPLAR